MIKYKGMKKSLLLILLALTSTTVVGCGPNNPDDPKKDPTEITGIEIAGDLTKKEYKYDDEWDLKGLSINGIQRNGEKVKLKSSDYLLTLSSAAPKNLTLALGITVKYAPRKTIYASRNFSDIYVADEEYDFEEEKTNYYSDCDLNLYGSELMNELHRHSFSKHTYFVQYGDTSAFLKKGRGYDSPDLIPGEHNTEYFYTGKKAGYNVGTREHVWPCANSDGLWVHDSRYEKDGHYVDSPTYVGGGSDLYHIRPSDPDVNTARGNSLYVSFSDSEFKGLSTVSVGDGGLYKLKVNGATKQDGKYQYAKYAEPADAFKGDIARTIAYIYMHYHTNKNTPNSYKSMTGALQIKDVLGYRNEEDCIEILKKWNKLDKPSPVEKSRNHVVQQIQGNRNPFVDDYTLIDKMFD